MAENVRTQLNLYGVITALFAIGFGAIVTTADPFKASWITFTFAYLCAFGFVFSAMTLVLYFVRPKSEHNLHYHRLGQANREAFFAAVFVVSSLFLASKGLLYWWIEATLFFALICIELFFLL
jgi:hypothetical protein